jgi:cobalt-precorrin-5B (C1)-methyltransferase
VDFRWLAERVRELGGNDETVYAVAQANTAIEVLEIAQTAGIALAPAVGRHAHGTAAKVLRDSGVALDIAIFDREGRLLAAADGS